MQSVAFYALEVFFINSGDSHQLSTELETIDSLRLENVNEAAGILFCSLFAKHIDYWLWALLYMIDHRPGLECRHLRQCDNDLKS